MNRAASALIVFGLVGGLAVPLVTEMCTPAPASLLRQASLALGLAVIGLVGVIAAVLLRSAEPWLAEEGRRQTKTWCNQRHCRFFATVWIIPGKCWMSPKHFEMLQVTCVICISRRSVFAPTT